MKASQARVALMQCFVLAVAVDHAATAQVAGLKTLLWQQLLQPFSVDHDIRNVAHAWCVRWPDHLDRLFLHTVAACSAHTWQCQ